MRMSPANEDKEYNDFISMVYVYQLKFNKSYAYICFLLKRACSSHGFVGHTLTDYARQQQVHVETRFSI